MMEFGFVRNTSSTSMEFSCQRKPENSENHPEETNVNATDTRYPVLPSSTLPFLCKATYGTWSESLLLQGHRVPLSCPGRAGDGGFKVGRGLPIEVNALSKSSAEGSKSQ